jgi:hypothetical protein
MTRTPFAHDAVVAMDPAGDERAPGAAITVALCGSTDHEPPCPLAPHHTHAERDGDDVRLRVLFAAEPDDEPRVRAMIDGALAHADAWELVRSGASPVQPAEADHAERLTRS